MNKRFSVVARRRVICGVIVLAIAELVIEVGALHHATVAGVLVPVVGVLSGLVYLRATRRRS